MNFELNIRKLPKQKRSQERYEKIMEVTFDLLGEVGYDALTTDLISQRSDIPIGTIYQFFPNKESIVFTHAEICFITLHDTFFSKLDIELKKYAKFDQRFLDKTLLIFSETLKKVKGYHLIGSVLYTNEKLRELDKLSNERFAKTLSEKVILHFFPKVEKKRALYIAHIVVETVDSVFKTVLSTQNAKLRSGLVSELKSLLFHYFSSFQ